MNRRLLLLAAMVAVTITVACGRQAFRGSPAGSVTTTPTPVPTATIFLFRKAITVGTSLSLGETLSRFPLLVMTTDASLAAHANSNGSDLVFTSSDGTTALPTEIERWDPSSGRLVAWVQAPVLGTAGSQIFLYYGKPSAVLSTSSAPAVWSSGFLGVWHLADDPGSGVVRDSLGVHPGVPTLMASSAQVAGAIGGSLAFQGSGAFANFVAVNSSNGDFDFPALSSFTFECWVFSPNPPGNGGNAPLGKGGARISADAGFDFELSVPWIANVLDPAQDVAQPTITAPIPDRWTHLAGVEDGQSQLFHVYLDAVEVLPAQEAPPGTISFPADPLTIGANRSGGLIIDPFRGGVDEVRISHGTRTPGWLHAEVAMVTSQGTLVLVGKEEAASPSVQPD